jgi:hypothetical protein
MTEEEKQQEVEWRNERLARCKALFDEKQWAIWAVELALTAPERPAYFHADYSETGPVTLDELVQVLISYRCDQYTVGISPRDDRRAQRAHAMLVSALDDEAAEAIWKVCAREGDRRGDEYGREYYGERTDEGAA